MPGQGIPAPALILNTYNMNVRIGNDIRLNLTLRYGNKTYSQPNIKQLRAYFINTAFNDFDCIHPMCENKRFPRDPNPFSHQVTPDCIGLCGRPRYHVMPHPHKYNPFSYPHWFRHHCPGIPVAHIPCNPAFGEGPLCPNYGHHCECCHWPDCPCDVHPMKPGFHSVECDFKYLAPSSVLPEQNRIQVYFPAHAQFSCGMYKLVIVLVTYEPGWGPCNLHHYTIDYGAVFNLVDEGGETGDITIDLDEDPQPEKVTVDGISPVNTSYTMNSSSSLNLGDKDVNNKVYNLNVSLSDDTSVVYDPSDWDYDTVTFTSSNNSVVSVDSNGKLTAATLAANSANKTATITAKIGSYTCSYTVTVKAPVVADDDSGYIGFSSTKPATGVYVDVNQLESKSTISGEYSVYNSTRGNYFWICSKKQLKSLLVGGFNTPFVTCGDKDGLHYYGGMLSLLAGEFDINIETT